MARKKRRSISPGEPEIEETLNELAIDGKVEALGDGEFKMTESGTSAAEAIIRAWGVDPHAPDALQQLKARGFFDTDLKGNNER